jgi:putative nucleotidyltransferase with HDIG domain
MDREQAEQLITSKINNLPTLPDIAHKVVSMVKDERSSAKDLSRLISYDQAISFRLLKVANSAYYGFSREVSSVQHAITILGFDEVKRLSVGIAVFDFMKGATNANSFMSDEFWKHSVGCSLAATIICKKIGELDLEMVSTASLLHDIGKLILNDFFTEEYRMILEKVQREEVSIVDVEKETLGFSHTDVGGWLSSKWSFPPSLNFPIAYHHQVGEVDQENILQVSIVHLADIICKKAKIGNSGDNGIPYFQKIAKETLQIKEEEIDSIIKELQSEEEKVQAFINSIN